MSGDDSTVGQTRRAVLKAAGAGSLAAALGTLVSEGALAHNVEPEPGTPSFGTVTTAPDAYPQGVASGGPTPEGAIVWTRVDPETYDGGALAVEVARDDEFEAVVYRGRVPESAVGPDHDHTINVDLATVDDAFAPDEEYHYRFVYRDGGTGLASPTGTFRTLPAPDASPDRLRLGVLTCNNYQNNYYGALGHVADEDLDYLVHTGDFVYEYAGEGSHPDRGIELPSGKSVAHTLEDFRKLHRVYRGDRFMRAALAAHPILLTWDDHEIVNNRWWNYEQGAPQTTSHPFGGDPEKMRQLYLAGIAALVEYVPMRVEYDPDADALHDVFGLYRSFQYGDLVDLFLTDERFYRSPPPEDGRGQPVEEAAGQGDTGLPPERSSDAEDRTMLGDADHGQADENQFRWLVDGVTGSDALWTAWAGSVLHVPFRYARAGPESFHLTYDKWDGYEHERAELLGAFNDADVENLVVFAGDFHGSLAGYLLEDYGDLAGQQPVPNRENRVGVEFMTPAISSNNLADVTDLPPDLYEEAVEAGIESQNPHIEWFNWTRNGYMTVEFNREACVQQTYAVDASVDSADAPRELMRAYRVPEGRVELEEFARGVSPDPYPEAETDPSDL